MLRAAVLVGTLVPVVLLRVIHAVLAAVPFAVGVTAEAPTGLSARGRQTDREEQGSGPKAHGDRGLRGRGRQGCLGRVARVAGGHTQRASSGTQSLHCPSLPLHPGVGGWLQTGKFKGNKYCLNKKPVEGWSHCCT